MGDLPEAGFWYWVYGGDVDTAEFDVWAVCSGYGFFELFRVYNG